MAGVQDSGQARSPEAERLLRAVAQYLLKHGLHASSMSKLAKDIGTNNRMLIYYFGSKEQLLSDATREAYDSFPNMRDFLPWLVSDGDLLEKIRSGWRVLRDEQSLDFPKLFFEGYMEFVRTPGDRDRNMQHILLEWPNQIERLFLHHDYDEAEARIAAEQLTSLWRGLQLSLIGGVPIERLDEAHDRAVEAMFGDHSR